MFGETNTVYFENQTEPINTLWGKTPIYHCAY